MDKEQAKKEIQALIEKYEQVESSGSIKKYSEEDTKNGFIRPLFSALGWDVDNRQEVTNEEGISGDRVDFGFYINGRVKFYLEAKPLKADIHSINYAKQAIKYSWNKGVTWAVLSDFESTIVFNADFQSSDLAHSKYFEINWNEYLEKFDQLWQLSKESFESGDINQKAEEWGKKYQRVPVSVVDSLYKTLRECREILTEEFADWNKGITEELLDEGVQKLLNRLVFIRVLEDREIEPPILKPLIREWESKNHEKDIEPLYVSMKAKFRELDEFYNSSIFSPHPFEGWNDVNNVTKKVIKLLYGKEEYYEYDFKIIPADILGSVYENYLGYKLSKSKKGTTLSKDSKKRKEHGIYYTPEYIVDFIIENSLVPLLKNCQIIDDIKKIKVLDPACGSGSFLIKAANAIHKRYLEMNAPDTMWQRILILTENIYGVDLDPQAIEIARLNLFINAITERFKLPELVHVQCGNSLISGTNNELEKKFGKDWRDKKAFNWHEEFPDVFKQGGFDVIVGNPPYSSKQSLQTKEIAKLFSTVEYKADLYAFFMERGYQLLKQGGLLGFIIPATWMTNYYYRKIRELLIKSESLNKIVMLDGAVFKDANVDTCLLFLEKDSVSSRKFTWLRSTPENLNAPTTSRSYGSVESEERYDIVPNNDKNWQKIKIKIDSESVRLNSLGKISLGMKLSSNKEFISNIQDIQHPDPIYFGDDIARYAYLTPSRFFNFAEAKIVGGTKKIEIHKAKPKILIQSIRNLSLKRRIVSSLEIMGFCFVGTVNAFILNNNHYDIRYIIGLLNSTLLNSYFSKRFTTISLTGAFLGILPIRIIDDSNKKYFQEIIDLVEKILLLQKEIKQEPEESENFKKLFANIERTDKKIDEEVYKLYGLTEEEIKIVEK